MARFDVHQFLPLTPAVPAVVDVQADLLASLDTRVVIPLAPSALFKGEELPRLKPVIDINGEPFILITTDIGVVRTGALGPVIVNIEDRRQIVIEAIDFLLQGF